MTQTRGVVILVPEATLEELRGDGYREASAAEVASWYRLRGITPPTCMLEEAQVRPLRVPFVIRVSDEGIAMQAG
jgi:hypothetical protein